MSCISNSLVLSKKSSLAAKGSHSKSLDHQLSSVAPCNLSFGVKGIGKTKVSTSKRALTIQAAYSRDDGSSSNFLGGFLLGGLIVGTLGFVYAPQISKALSGADKKEIMSKLPKFIYDEEKALERQRKELAEKIAQLNSAIDEVSAELRSDDTQNEPPVDADAENEASVSAEEELEVAL